MKCQQCKKEICKDQTPFQIAPGVFVHYTKCKALFENSIHCNGWLVTLRRAS